MKYTKAMRQADFFRRMSDMGFSYGETQRLRRIEMTLSRWSEAECNGEIERDGEQGDGKPFRVYEPAFTRDSRYPGVPPMRKRYPIPDRETGALKRAKAILAARNARAYVDGICQNPATFYHQGDPRGCSLYIVTAEHMKDRFAEWQAAHVGANPACYDFAGINSLYTRGVAVCY